MEGYFEVREVSPRYIGPYEIVDKVGEAAYRLRLPLELANNVPVPR